MEELKEEIKFMLNKFYERTQRDEFTYEEVLKSYTEMFLMMLQDHMKDPESQLHTINNIDRAAKKIGS